MYVHTRFEVWCRQCKQKLFYVYFILTFLCTVSSICFKNSTLTRGFYLFIFSVSKSSNTLYANTYYMRILLGSVVFTRWILIVINNAFYIWIVIIILNIENITLKYKIIYSYEINYFCRVYTVFLVLHTVYIYINNNLVINLFINSTIFGENNQNLYK